MIHILLLNQKGGVGKSMLADEIAFSFERTGQRVAFYDLDDQGGTIHKNRDQTDPEVCVIDTPGALQKDLDAWLKETEIVVIPTRTSHREIEPLLRIIEAVDRYPEKQVLYVLNEFNQFKVSAAFRQWIHSVRSNARIVTLKHYEKIDQAGLKQMSVVEYAPASPAAKAVLEVVNEVRKLAGFPEEECRRK